MQQGDNYIEAATYIPYLKLPTSHWQFFSSFHFLLFCVYCIRVGTSPMFSDLNFGILLTIGGYSCKASKSTETNFTEEPSHRLGATVSSRPTATNS